MENNDNGREIKLGLLKNLLGMEKDSIKSKLPKKKGISIMSVSVEKPKTHDLEQGLEDEESKGISEMEHGLEGMKSAHEQEPELEQQEEGQEDSQEESLESPELEASEDEPSEEEDQQLHDAKLPPELIDMLKMLIMSRKK